jgi:hypothetical protein
MEFITCQFNFVFKTKYGVADPDCEQHCDLPNGPGGGGSGDAADSGPVMIIVIVVCLLFLLTCCGYCYWRRMRDDDIGKDNGKEGGRSNRGWFSKKDRETLSMKTAKLDDMSLNGHPTTVRKTIHFGGAHSSASRDSTY